LRGGNRETVCTPFQAIDSKKQTFQHIKYLDFPSEMAFSRNVFYKEDAGKTHNHETVFFIIIDRFDSLQNAAKNEDKILGP
jgi:hypothetical protein